jgi:hypothetical protein
MVYAAEGGHINIVEWLLGQGVALSCGSKQLSISHFAAGGDHDQFLRWLVKQHTEVIVGQVRSTPSSKQEDTPHG